MFVVNPQPRGVAFTLEKRKLRQRLTPCQRHIYNPDGFTADQLGWATSSKLNRLKASSENTGASQAQHAEWKAEYWKLWSLSPHAVEMQAIIS